MPKTNEATSTPEKPRDILRDARRVRDILANYNPVERDALLAITAADLARTSAAPVSE